MHNMHVLASQSALTSQNLTSLLTCVADLDHAVLCDNRVTLTSLPCVKGVQVTGLYDAGTIITSPVRVHKFKPEDPGFDPLAGQGEKRVFLSP